MSGNGRAGGRVDEERGGNRDAALGLLQIRADGIRHGPVVIVSVEPACGQPPTSERVPAGGAHAQAARHRLVAADPVMTCPGLGTRRGGVPAASRSGGANVPSGSDLARTAPIGPNGRFAFRNLPPGRHRLVITSPSRTVTRYVDPPDHPAVVTLEVEADR